MNEDINKMTSREIEQEMRDSRSWDSRYFSLETELEERE